MSAAPGVTAIIPAYNGSRWIAEAILSIDAQTRPPDEIIVVDDGSVDDTAALVRERFPHVRLVSQPNRGEQIARNHGLSLAAHEIVAYLDQDDLWLPLHLETALTHLTSVDDSPALAPLDIPIDGDATLAGLEPRIAEVAVAPHDTSTAPITTDGLLAGGIGGANCLVAHRDLLRSIGGFPTLSPGIGDYLVLIVLAHMGRLVQIEQPTFAYRSHAAMSTYSYNMCERTILARLLAQRSGLLPDGRSTWDSYLVRGFIEDVDAFTARRAIEALAYAMLAKASPRVVVGGVARRAQRSLRRRASER